MLKLAYCTIDRGSIGDTVIKNFLDNQVHGTQRKSERVTW